MSSEQAMREAVREAGVEAGLIYEDVTDSTNTTAMRLAAEGAAEWTIVVAGHQTGGRGRLGRTWLSEPGDALLCSLILRPELPPRDAGLLTLLAAVAMAEAARVSCNAEIRCKWPNDLLIGGRKAGGILTESSVSGRDLTHVVIGTGVNVKGAPAGVPEATSLGGGDPAVLLSAFLGCFKQRYRVVERDFGRTILDAYRKVSATLGREVRAETVDGRFVDGRAVDLDDHGNLVVEAPSGFETIAFGQIAHLER